MDLITDMLIMYSSLCQAVRRTQLQVEMINSQLISSQYLSQFNNNSGSVIRTKMINNIHSSIINQMILINLIISK